MTTAHHDALAQQLKEFQNEKERIRAVLGQIGGAGDAKRDRLVTVVFVAAMSGLFILDTLRHLLGTDIPLPPLFSIQLGVLLVSIKIIWMLNAQTRIAHFQFWMLHSIEFRINEISARLRGIERQSGKDAQGPQESCADRDRESPRGDPLPHH